MKKLTLLALGLLSLAAVSYAEDVNKIQDVYYKSGPIELMMPLRSVSALYQYDFKSQRNLVGGETPVFRLWDKLEGNGGIVTSLKGRGTAFASGSLMIGNMLERYITLPADLGLGAFGGWDFRDEAWMYGLKASYKLW